jgi:hypothetical protein
MTKVQAVSIIESILSTAYASPSAQSKQVAETIIKQLDGALQLEPTVVEMSAVVHAVSLFS